ncbi:polysaccharide biosynthesis protein GtrA [Halobellus salinus]|uniref:Polysaccharide biosynthesis protein GtrA n=1 Tax=Halobellus salinus TaxID=931585 RepID=A0A830EBL6_9EURY|nr:GtrA family protein [Halobellus salinus]GGJ08561.1 polysaccharide biosynthesis protein GtrA [Halobellus salinus]SMP28270.1 Putative flippase GtrA (transmembrane translocase of bactoprenol-linked glucose) [Halobellus salinus]
MVRRFLRNLHSGPLALQLRRFVIVGAVTAGIQQVLLWFFINVAGLFYLLAALVAIEITIVLSYVLNNAWTFQVSKNTGTVEYLAGLLKTNVVRGTAIPIQLGILYALVESGALHSLAAGAKTVGPAVELGALEPLAAAIGPIEPLVANAVAIVVSGLYRYVLDAKWTWGQ